MREIQPRPKSMLSDYRDGFVEHLASKDLAPSTIRGYANDLCQFERWLGGVYAEGVAIDNVTTTDVAAFRQYLVNVKNRRASTVNRRIQTVKNFFSWASSNGHINGNPAEKIRFMKKATRNHPRVLVEKEVHGLLRSSGRSTHGLAKRNYALVQLMIQTGLRLSEAATLQIANITISKRCGVVRVSDGKGHKEREVPLNAAARRALSAYLADRQDANPAEVVFLTKRGTPMSVRTIQGTIGNLARRAGISRIDVSPHTLRHTFAANYLKSNPGKLVELAVLMGHESLDTTAIYTRPSTESIAEDLERSPYNVY